MIEIKSTNKNSFKWLSEYVNFISQLFYLTTYLCYTKYFFFPFSFFKLLFLSLKWLKSEYILFSGVVRGRSRREAVLSVLDSMQTFNYTEWTSKSNNDSHPIKRDVRDLDIIQKYLKQMNPKADYNDEVMASYLQCSGMLNSNNHCLERLVCQFSDPTSKMDSLEKDVSSL